MRRVRSQYAEAVRFTPTSDVAHRGYLIRFNRIAGTCWVEKDGTLICWAQDANDARRQIDALLD